MIICCVVLFYQMCCATQSLLTAKVQSCHSQVMRHQRSGGCCHCTWNGTCCKHTGRQPSFHAGDMLHAADVTIKRLPTRQPQGSHKAATRHPTRHHKMLADLLSSRRARVGCCCSGGHSCIKAATARLAVPACTSTATAPGAQPYPPAAALCNFGLYRAATESLTLRKEKEEKRLCLPASIIEKPSFIPGCPGIDAHYRTF